MENNNELQSLSDFVNETVNSASSQPTLNVEKSPLERMRESQESNPSGMILNTADITKDGEKKFLKNNMENEQRDEEFQNYLATEDKKIEAAKHITFARPPQNQFEDMAMMHQLDAVARQGDIVPEGAPSEEERNNTLQKYGMKPDDKLGSNISVDGKEVDFIVKDVDGNTVAPEDIPTQTDDPSDEDFESVGKEREDLINVLIDKTGLGIDVIFTEEERSKITRAKELVVTEVEDIELQSLVFTKPTGTYVENIATMDTSEIGTITIPLVASRYMARVKGLGYGQMGDLLLDMKVPMFEQVFKHLSTAYNSIVWTSIGKFESFEDFLRKTAWVDMQFLIYGIIVETYPELDKVGMKCGNCKRDFEQEYATRELFNLKTASDEYLNQLKNLTSVDPANAESYSKDSPISKLKMVKYPLSNRILKVGVISCYDYLYHIMPNITANSFKKNHPDDFNSFLETMILYIPYINSISTPNPDGTYNEYTEFEDMVQALYYSIPEELPLINGIVAAYSEAYGYTFNVRTTKCPHCGHTSYNNEINLNELLFSKASQLMSTSVDIKTTLGI